MKLRIDFRDAKQKEILQSILSKINTDYTITFEKKNPTPNMYRYYRGVVLKLIADFTGHNRQEIHEALLYMFSRYLTIEDNTDTWEVKRTGDMSQREFADYIDQCIIWSAWFLGLVIPDARIIEEL